MLLFSRVVTLTGSPRQALPWAVGITEYVNSHADLDVALWSYDFGRPVGTLAWSAYVESQVALAESTAKLLADDGYFDQIEQAQALVTEPGVDRLREVISGQAGEMPAIGAVATITTATALVDRMADAVGWAVEIAEYASELTGASVALLTNVYGQMGELAWIGVQPDLASGEAARTKLGADPGYLSRLGATKELFVPASGYVSHLSRIA